MEAVATTAELPVRDRRLKSVLTYEGTAEDLNEKSTNQQLKNQKRAFQQCSDCSQMCAETLTYCIRNAAVIVHSPIGCCSAAAPSNVAIGVVARERGIEGKQEVHAICSNIKEKDTVYGAAKKLAAAIDTAYERWNPPVIFVQSSCAAGIIGDDIESVTNEAMQKYNIPVVPVFCEGFKSRVWTSGFDAVFHGVLRKVVEPPRKKQADLVNLFNFMGSDTFTPLLAKLGLRTNYLLPLADTEAIKHMSEAACSASICETLATYIAHGLEVNYGVPEIRAMSPFGVKWTDDWLREIASVTGKGDIVEDVIAAEHARIKPDIDRLRSQLEGRTVYVFAGDSYAHSLLNMAIDLGLKPVGATTLHHDQRTDSGEDELNTLGALIRDHGDFNDFRVCNKQPHQMVKVLQEVKPDVMIVRHQGLTIIGTKLGIPTICEGDVNASAGYDGIVKLGQRLVDVLNASPLIKSIAEHAELPYTDQWLSQKQHFVKDVAR